MLRNVLIMASSGIVLFSKEFVNTIAQPRLVGSLLTAMLEFSTKTTGAPVSYIELSNVAVTIVTTEKSKVFCAMFHDTTDGYKFSSFIAKEILEAFIQVYAADLGNIGHNLRDFHRFHYHISEVIRESVKPILLKLQQQRGIMKAIFIIDDSVSYATVDVDQLGVLANLQSLINLSSDMTKLFTNEYNFLVAYVGESVKSITIQSSRNTCTQVSTIENGTLIVMYKKGIHAQKNMIAIKDSADMLRRVCLLMRNLHQPLR